MDYGMDGMVRKGIVDWNGLYGKELYCTIPNGLYILSLLVAWSTESIDPK